MNPTRTGVETQERGQTRRTVLRAVGTLAALGVVGTGTVAASTELVPDGSGDATITTPGHYTSDATFRTVTISSDDVTLDGITFGGGAPAAIKNGVAGLSNITIRGCSISGYSGRGITFGFAEGVSNAGNRAANITLHDNELGEMTGANATAIAIFDTDGVTVTKNTVDRSNETNLGRRGINLDGNTDVTVRGNTVDLGASGPTGSPNFPVFFAARWCIQISMSNAPVSDVDIVNNTLVGSYDGVAVLSQRDVTGLKLRANDIETVFGFRVNAGLPGSLTTLIYSDFKVNGNRFDASRFTGGTTGGVRLQNLFKDTKDITYRDVTISGNTATDVDDVVVIQEDGITVDNVKVNGNKSR